MSNFVTNLLNIPVIVFKKPNVLDDFINLECLSISLKISILNIIALLCTLNILTSLMNFSLSLNRLKTFPWWYAMDMILFFFVRIMSAYCFITAAVSQVSLLLSAFWFDSSISASVTSLLTMESSNCFFISSFLSRLVFFLSEPFCSYK